MALGDPPDHIEELYDQLEEHEDALSLLAGISSREAAWLAKHAKECMQVEREHVGEEIERELQVIILLSQRRLKFSLRIQTACPPRDVRSFRVIDVEDSQTCRRPANRYAQLTVWDIFSLTLSEGVKPGAIEVGSRFLVRSPMIIA
jgi:breast cancer 2 susceptibility protein